jgi:hypothetical protein
MNKHTVNQLRQVFLEKLVVAQLLNTISPTFALAAALALLIQTHALSFLYNSSQYYSQALLVVSYLQNFL